METKYPYAVANYTLQNTTFYACGMPREDAFHIWRSATTGDIPWPGALFGLTALGLFTWCQDQVRAFHYTFKVFVKNQSVGTRTCKYKNYIKIHLIKIVAEQRTFSFT